MESYLQLDKYSNFNFLAKEEKENLTSSHLDWAIRSERSKDQ
jgi:hypothetical protein